MRLEEFYLFTQNEFADIAQLAEQPTCNRQVFGSNPNIGFSTELVVHFYGRIPKWPKGADCKSVIDDFEGSNPSPPIPFTLT